jgi:hypothetical protein
MFQENRGYGGFLSDFLGGINCGGGASLTPQKKMKKTRPPLKNVEQMEQTEQTFIIKDLHRTSLFLP